MGLEAVPVPRSALRSGAVLGLLLSVVLCGCKHKAGKDSGSTSAANPREETSQSGASTASPESKLNEHATSPSAESGVADTSASSSANAASADPPPANTSQPIRLTQDMRQQVAASVEVLRWLHEYSRDSQRNRSDTFQEYVAQESYVQERVTSDGIRRQSWLDVRDDKAATSIWYHWPQVYTRLSGSGSDTVRLEYCQDWTRDQPGKVAPNEYGMVSLTLKRDSAMGFVVQKERISERAAWRNCRLGMASEWRLSAAAQSAHWIPEPCELYVDDPHCEILGAYLLVSSRTETQVVYLDLESGMNPEFEVDLGHLSVQFANESSRGQLRFRREGQTLQLEVRWFDNDQLPTGAYYAGPRIDLRTSLPIPLLCQPPGEDGSLSDDRLAPCMPAAPTL